MTAEDNEGDPFAVIDSIFAMAHKLKKPYGSWKEPPKECGYRGCAVVCNTFEDYKDHLMQIHGKTVSDVGLGR